jgi:HSP20 family protein
MEMALMRFDTFRDLDRLAQQMFTGNGGPVAARSMPLDAFRRGEQFVINLDLPGVDPASIDLSVEKNVLTVRAERSWSPAEGDEVLITERPQGSFTRQLFLGDNLDTDKVTANYDQGVLCVTIPIAEAAKPRRVQITTGGTNTSIEAGVH